MKNIRILSRIISLLSILFFLTESLHSQYVTNGSAVSIGNDCYRLTTATISESGNVLSSSPIDLSLPFDLYASLNFGNVDADGADGITFIFANNNSFVGTPAQNLGYGSISPSFVVEMDTWDNGAAVNDPVEDHIGIQQNGDVTHGSANTLVNPIEISNIEDGEDHCVHVSWDPVTQFFALTLDNTTITYTGDISAIFGGNTSVYYGFTSATGGFYNEHTVCFTGNPASVDIQELSPLCLNSAPIQLTATPAGGTWGGVATVNGEINPMALGEGIYEVTYTYTDGNGCTNEATEFIEIADAPTVMDVNTNCTPTQDGYILTFEITGGDPATYTVAGSTGGSLTTDAPYIFTSNVIPSDGMYSFSVYDDNNCEVVDISGSFACQCFTSAGTMVPDPIYLCVDETATATFNNDEFLDPDDLLLFVLHDNSGNTLGTVFDRQSTPTFSFLPTMATGVTYYISSIAGNEDNGEIDETHPCFSVSPGTPVQWNDYPTGSLAESQTICAGDTATLVFNLNGAPPFDVMYTVNGANNTLTGIENGHTIQVVLFETTNYTLLEINDSSPSGCPTALNSGVTVTVNECFIEGTLTGSIIPCEATIGSLTLAMIAGEVPFTYEYTGTSTGTGTINNLNEATTITNLPAGNYTVTITSNNGISTVLVAEIEQLFPPVATATVDFEISCFNEMDGTATASATGGQTPYTYEWSTSETSPTIEDLSAGLFTVTVTDANNCTSETQVMLTEPTALAMSFIVSNPDCFDDSNGSVEAVLSGGTPPYQVAINGSNFQDNTTFTGLQSGAYQITAQDANGCTIDEAFAINASISVEVSLGDDQYIDLGDDAQLNALVNVPLDALVNLSWTNIEDTDCPSCPLQIVTPIITTTYSVTVQTSDGCLGTDNLTVFVDRRKAIYVPNAFSPNGDGTNDVFYPFSDTETVKNIKSFQVFSRWGNLVYEYANFLPNTPAHGWDGTFQSQVMNPAVFVWYAEVEFIDGEVIVLKGDVALTR